MPLPDKPVLTMRWLLASFAWTVTSKPYCSLSSDISRGVGGKECQAQTYFVVAEELEPYAVPEDFGFYIPSTAVDFQLITLHSMCYRTLNLSFSLETKLNKTQRPDQTHFEPQACYYSQGYGPFETHLHKCPFLSYFIIYPLNNEFHSCQKCAK